jgi:hypothetical protein
MRIPIILIPIMVIPRSVSPGSSTEFRFGGCKYKKGWRKRFRKIGDRCMFPSYCAASNMSVTAVARRFQLEVSAASCLRPLADNV